ncbi:DUF397 domain-containing protein [Actinomadura latina]|uniref:DUF397 domain-containing protein n=1 Tax=Actinomadura latina TaxID=163603 RepID=A0A846Z0F7_9ACTN|nr:DUF397 domain-containing protein [Actinomadura latina]NKZ05781.1 DUF397 domain-containing protein [Actinomadura latina]
MSTSKTSNVRWRKSSQSGPEGGECVEVAEIASAVGVRDSKDPDGPILTFGVAEWRAFAQHVKVRKFDLQG